MADYWNYCALPGGNKDEFPALDEELRRRKVKCLVSELPHDGRIYRVSSSEFDKLPQDERGPYLGNDDSGYSLTPNIGAAYELLRKRYNGSEWKEL